MQNETTVRYHLVPVRMTIVKKTGEQVLVWMWRKGSPWALFAGM